MNKKKRTIITVIISIAIFLLILVQFSVMYALSSQLIWQEKERVWDTRLIYACYNNAIHPCDDAGVSKWNTANPDKVVTADYLQGK